MHAQWAYSATFAKYKSMHPVSEVSGGAWLGKSLVEAVVPHGCGDDAVAPELSAQSNRWPLHCQPRGE